MQDGVGVDAVMTVEIGDRAGLAEMLDAERFYAMARNAPQPGQGSRMAVDDGDQAAVAPERREQRLDMAARAGVATLARPLRRLPARIDPVGRGDGEQPDVAA